MKIFIISANKRKKQFIFDEVELRVDPFGDYVKRMFSEHKAKLIVISDNERQAKKMIIKLMR